MYKLYVLYEIQKSLPARRVRTEILQSKLRNRYDIFQKRFIGIFEFSSVFRKFLKKRQNVTIYRSRLYYDWGKPGVIYEQEIIAKWSSMLVLPKNK